MITIVARKSSDIFGRCTCLSGANKILNFQMSSGIIGDQKTESEQLSLRPRIEEYSNRLDVRLPRWSKTLHLSYIWLRDHCRCPKCYSEKSSQRINDVCEIPLNIRPMLTSSTNEHLIIHWPDGHESEYEFKFLWQSSFEGSQSTLKPHTVSTWTKATFPLLESLTIPLESYKSAKEEKTRLIHSILKNGVGVVSEVPSTVEDTRKVVEMLFPIKRTFFGEMWAFQDDYKHDDSAYTNEYLGAHTDTTYLTEASRLQIFHALQAAEDGGETLLVDGFNVAKQFKKQYPKGYEFLSTTPFPSEYIGDGQHQKSLDLVFKHNPLTKSLFQFRYNIYDRAPLSSIPFEKLQEYYEHLHNLTSIIRLPKNEVWIKLQPGQVLFINNWRVMHGRNAYSGSRIMGGCYVNNADFLSKARVLGINVD